MSPPTRHGLWPNARQRCLVEAAIADRDVAREAWQRWQHARAGDDVCKAELRILGAAHRNISIDHDLADRAETLIRTTALRNLDLLDVAANTCEVLRRHEIPAVTIKGVVLAFDYYDAPGLCPMNDIDIFVPQALVRRTQSVLQSAGWHANPSLGSMAPYQHAHDFVRDSFKLDVHQYLLKHGTHPDSEASFIARCKTSRGCSASKGLPVADATDLLLLACLAGLSRTRRVNLRWVLDAKMILAHADTRIDWPSFIRQVELRRIVMPVREALTYLAETVGLPIPPNVLTTLARLRVSRAGRRWYELNARHPRTLRDIAQWHLLKYDYGRRGGGRGYTVASMMRFLKGSLQASWGLDSGSSIPRRAVQGLLKHAKRSLHDRHMGGRSSVESKNT